MRKLLLAIIAILGASGVALVMLPARSTEPGWAKSLSLLHIWGGYFFIVAFPLYAWDHVARNRAWLRVAALVTFTGTVQLLSGAVLILTGIVLLLYGNASWPALRSAHHLLTYLLLVSVALHFLSPKQRG
ncbi:MAG: hypothetical protein HY423_11315 [Candidatus Lambdaproteobacteria bacterium]|nr:hypothetical protein [Candidatus Lambdaproteobacteria bacterium]